LSKFINLIYLPHMANSMDSFIHTHYNSFILKTLPKILVSLIWSHFIHLWTIVSLWSMSFIWYISLMIFIYGFASCILTNLIFSTILVHSYPPSCFPTLHLLLVPHMFLLIFISLKDFVPPHPKVALYNLSCNWFFLTFC
jgi:hypothetical protein